jgi:signal transduction histidine kinase/DNA-binding response OmpR family regulator
MASIAAMNMAEPENPRIRQLEAEIARLGEELTRQRAEIDGQRAEIDGQRAEIEAHRARAALLTGVSHDLRTPLTLILGPLEEMLSVGGLPAHMRQGLRRVQRSADRMHRTLERVLDLARAGEGALVPRPAALDMGKLLAAIVEDAEATAKARGIILAFRRDVKLHTVRADAHLFERIVLNLIGNALDFTPRGGVIEVDLSIGDDVVLRVRDTGPGLAPGARARIAARTGSQGVSGQDCASRDGAGDEATSGPARTGLGLALVAELVSLMDGHLYVDSEVGKGSLFTVTLPAVPCGDESAGEPAPVSGRPRFGVAERDHERPRASGESDFEIAPAAPRPRILVVEDKGDMRAYLQELLDREFEVSAAGSGASALDMVQTQAFDIVVADVMMPEINGFELVSAIKSNPLLAHIPIILVTARGAAEAALGLDIGADDYLAKPFAPGELIARVRAARRTAEVQRRLCNEWYMAGMAESANNLVHQLGDIMSTIKDSLGVVAEQLDAAWAPASLGQLVKKLEQKEKGLDDTRDIFHLPVYLNSLATQLNGEQRIMAAELAALKRWLGHIDNVVRAQQELARYAGVTEMVVPAELTDAALEQCAEGLVRAGIEVQRDEEDLPPIGIDRHRSPSRHAHTGAAHR